MQIMLRTIQKHDLITLPSDNKPSTPWKTHFLLGRGSLSVVWPVKTPSGEKKIIYRLDLQPDSHALCVLKAIIKVCILEYIECAALHFIYGFDSRKTPQPRWRTLRSPGWTRSRSTCSCATRTPTSTRTSLGRWSNWRPTMTRSWKSPRSARTAPSVHYIFDLLLDMITLDIVGIIVCVAWYWMLLVKMRLHGNCAWTWRGLE